MKVGINTLAIVPGFSGGDATYVRNLAKYLARIDSVNSYYLLVAPQNQALFEVRSANFQQVICNIPLQSMVYRALWEQLSIPRLVKRLQLDMLHSPVNVAPLWLSGSSVLTLLEAEPFMRSTQIPLPLRIYWRVLRKQSALRASKILTISNSSRDEIIRWMGIDPANIRVTYLGVEPRFRPVEDISLLKEIKEQYAGGADYIFWVGRSYPRKNLVRLLQAYRMLREKHHILCKLLVVGVQGWGDKALHSQYKMLLTPSDVAFADRVPDEVLPALYSAAKLFVFPSLHEGFGLPILEAMACGTPVVTSNCTAMPEVAGDAAVLVDPTCVDSIADGMYRLLTDQTLHAVMSKRGLQRASQFSWFETARQTLAVYESVC